MVPPIEAQVCGHTGKRNKPVWCAGLTEQGITAITTESTELGGRNYFARTDTLVHTQARPLPSWVGAVRCLANLAPSLSSR